MRKYHSKSWEVVQPTTWRNWRLPAEQRWVAPTGSTALALLVGICIRIIIHHLTNSINPNRQTRFQAHLYHIGWIPRLAATERHFLSESITTATMGLLFSRCRHTVQRILRRETVTVRQSSVGMCTARTSQWFLGEDHRKSMETEETTVHPIMSGCPLIFPLSGKLPWTPKINMSRSRKDRNHRPKAPAQTSSFSTKPSAQVQRRKKRPEAIYLLAGHMEVRPQVTKEWWS